MPELNPDLLQWPAMAVTLSAAWLIAAKSKRRRNVGFWVFLASNLLWIAWGLHAGAYALIVLQIGLAALNLRGTVKTEASTGAEPEEGTRNPTAGGTP